MASVSNDEAIVPKHSLERSKRTEDDGNVDEEEDKIEEVALAGRHSDLCFDVCRYCYVRFEC